LTKCTGDARLHTVLLSETDNSNKMKQNQKAFCFLSYYSSADSYIDKPLNRKIPNLNINPLLKVTINRAIKEVSSSVDIVQNHI